MKQNIYDNTYFFTGYMDLRSNESGINGAIEEPAIYSLLPSLKDLRILDLGCGFGKIVSFCLQKGAAYVLGVDISQNMVSEAKKRIKDPRASFTVTPIDDYKKETIRVSHWFIDGVIKYHRTIEAYINELIDSGFTIKRCLEPGPTSDSLTERPELYEHLRRPPILVLTGIRNAL